MVTGISGGIVRDVLVMEVPTVLRTELYAVAALLGAAVLVGGRMLGLSSHVAAPTGAALCIALRVMAIHYGWPLAGCAHKGTIVFTEQRSRWTRRNSKVRPSKPSMKEICGEGRVVCVHRLLWFPLPRGSLGSRGSAGFPCSCWDRPEAVPL